MSDECTPKAQRLLDLVGEVHGFASLAEFRVGVIEALSRAVPADWTAYNEVGRGPEDTVVLAIPPITDALVARFAELADENPLVKAMRLTLDGRPRRISDLMDQETFHATTIYREVYSVMHVEAQVAFTLPATPPLILGIALCRSAGDFTDDEVQLLALARPHLIQAYRSAQLASEREATLAALEHGLDSFGRHVVVLDGHGGVEFATDGACRLLGARPGSRGELPSDLQQRVAAHRGSRAAARPLVLTVKGSAVAVRVLPTRAEDRRDVLLLESDADGLSVAALEGLGLTAREAQVLRRIALGESAAKAAKHISIAPRTAEKHLQSAYRKLGVHSREQASATAWAAVGVERPS
jgi:DNA-binding CsgD family transcriptional regulator